MAIIQTDVAKGYRQVAQPAEANSLNTARFHIDLTNQAITTADIVEMGILPAYCRIRSATIIPVGIGSGVNCDVGIMSGDVGSTDPARTSGDQIFDGQAINATPVNSADPDMYALTFTDKDRSIGLKVDANVAAGAKSITLLVDYYQ